MANFQKINPNTITVEVANGQSEVSLSPAVFTDAMKVILPPNPTAEQVINFTALGVIPDLYFIAVRPHNVPEAPFRMNRGETCSFIWQHQTGAWKRSA